LKRPGSLAKTSPGRGGRRFPSTDKDRGLEKRHDRGAKAMSSHSGLAETAGRGWLKEDETTLAEDPGQLSEKRKRLASAAVEHKQKGGHLPRQAGGHNGKIKPPRVLTKGSYGRHTTRLNTFRKDKGKRCTVTPRRKSTRSNHAPQLEPWSRGRVPEARSRPRGRPLGVAPEIKRNQRSERPAKGVRKSRQTFLLVVALVSA